MLDPTNESTVTKSVTGNVMDDTLRGDATLKK